MAIALLSWVNHVDAAATVLSSSGHVGDLAPANLADPIIGRRCRLSSLSGYVQADFIANASVGVLALVFPRDTPFPTSGTVAWTLDANGGTAGAGVAHSSGAVSIGAVDGYGYHVRVLPNSVNARYVRATFAVSGLDYIDVGRLWAGVAWRPTYDVSALGGYEEKWGDLSRVHTAQRSGAEYVDRRPRQRQFSFALDALASDDRDDIREMQRLVGVAEQVLFSLDPDVFATETVLGRLDETQPIRHRALTAALYQKAFVIRESL